MKSPCDSGNESTTSFSPKSLASIVEESSEKSDSDEELIMILRQYNVRTNVERFYEVTVPRYSPDIFTSHFRISRVSVEKLVNDINSSYVNVRGRPPIPVEKSILLTIWTLANQECFRSVSDRFALPRGHAHTIVLKVCKLLCNNVNKYIIWPKNEEARQNMIGFDTLRGERSFPNVFGCVDGSHIFIPGKEDNSYYNRKGLYSIVLQAVCNSKKKIINVTCGWPGSFHDARVWKSSKIYNKLKYHKQDWLPGDTYLVGDSAYPLDKFIMVPFKDNGHLTRAQKLFNARLSSTSSL